jgi:hypothetical protein
MENDFEAYLAKKNIDSQKFKAAEPQRYVDFLGLFGQMHEDSFTLQKLYLINQIRRKYCQVQYLPVNKIL